MHSVDLDSVLSSLSLRMLPEAASLCYLLPKLLIHVVAGYCCLRLLRQWHPDFCTHRAFESVTYNMRGG